MRNKRRRRRRGDGESDLDPIQEEDEYEEADQVPIEPPQPDEMDFNEHDIMGVFDKDENGIIVITNNKGQLTDKRGGRVNERG